MSWKDYFKKSTTTMATTVNATSTAVVPNIAGTTSGTITTSVSSPSAIWHSVPGVYGTTIGATYAGGSGMAGGFTFAPPAAPPNIITLNSQSKEIVRLNHDGSVTWNSEINVDEAAEAFGRSISLGAEISAGLTKQVKLRMRDSIFEDLISIAKDKGSLSAEDLTYLLEASKIVEKLKGGKEQ